MLIFIKFTKFLHTYIDKSRNKLGSINNIVNGIPPPRSHLRPYISTSIFFRIKNIFYFKSEMISPKVSTTMNVWIKCTNGYGFVL